MEKPNFGIEELLIGCLVCITITVIIVSVFLILKKPDYPKEVITDLTGIEAENAMNINRLFDEIAELKCTYKGGKYIFPEHLELNGRPLLFQNTIPRCEKEGVKYYLSNLEWENSKTQTNLLK